MLLHGMASEYGGGADGIALRDFRDKGIDYLALGHIHSYQQEQLDDRGIWCYSGCLEGRGFDECGPKGYVKLEIEDGHVQSEFVPCACRTLHEDQTRLLIRPEDYQYDVSLKGELVRQVMASELSEEEKEEILRLGLRALNGEE